MNKKLEVARAAVSNVKDNDIVGLGASGSMSYLADFLAEKIASGMQVKLVTSSFVTRQLLLQKGLAVQSIADTEMINIYIDGCDQFDSDLNALKSGGGIHTREKLLASMAQLFILIGDDTKYTESLTDKFPLVVEVLPEAWRYVPRKIQASFPGVKTAFRENDKKEWMVVTDHGNYLLDVWFPEWPDLKQTNTTLKNITGVVETSLFTGLAHKAIIATKDNEIVFVEKKWH